MTASHRHPVATTRRTFLAGGLSVGAAALLVGPARRIGASAPPETDPSGAAASGSSPDASMPAASFPLTFEHVYGSTTIETQPARVVTAGFNDADFALAVGVVPVGVANFIGDFDEDSRPWAQEALAGAEPEVVTNDAGELQLERIAALEPDVIIYYSYLAESDYEKLSEIAPTIVEPAPGSLWEQHTLDVGRVLGRDAEAAAAVATVQDRFAAVAEEHPEFAGVTAALLFGPVGDGIYYLLEPTDPRVGLFLSLGFVLPETTGEISREQLDLIDQELVIAIGYDRETIESDPLLSGLAAVREGRIAYLGTFDGEFAGALGFDSPLSLPAAIDIAVPELAKAVAGEN